MYKILGFGKTLLNTTTYHKLRNLKGFGFEYFGKKKETWVKK